MSFRFPNSIAELHAELQNIQTLVRNSNQQAGRSRLALSACATMMELTLERVKAVKLSKRVNELVLQLTIQWKQVMNLLQKEASQAKGVEDLKRENEALKAKVGQLEKSQEPGQNEQKLAVCAD